jgi:hypothetical protein
MTAFEGVPGPIPVVAVEVPAVVLADTPCRKCQYNLRGLSTDGRCPECGTAVGLSIRGDLLRYSDPAWVATLRAGVRCMLWAIVISIGGAVLGRVVTGMTGSRVIAAILPLGGTALSLVGAWLLTTPDPSGLGEDKYGTSRKLIRVTLAVSILSELVQFARTAMNAPPTLGLVFSLVGAVATLIGLVGTFATLNYLSKLARRLPDEGLAARARMLTYGYGIPLAAMAVIGLAMILAFRFGGRPTAGLMGLGCAAALCGVVWIVFGVMYLVMLVRFANAFGEQAARARATWAAGTA